MKPPNNTRIEISGIMELMPSAAPRLVASVASVSHALYAASFAVEPKKVITQSRIMTSVIPTEAVLTAAPNREEITSARIRANAMIEIPQAIYPAHMKILRLPIRSDRAPIRIVVSVAATALAVTISAMSEAEARNIL